MTFSSQTLHYKVTLTQVLLLIVFQGKNSIDQTVNGVIQKLNE